MVTRIIWATIKMACCRDGQQVYNPHPRTVIASQIKKSFDEPINSWKKRAEEALYEKYHLVAENECSTMGTLSLCSFGLKIDDMIETKASIPQADIEKASGSQKFISSKIPISDIVSETKPAPNFIYQQLNHIQERMSEADSVDEFLALKDEMNKLRMRYRM